MNEFEQQVADTLRWLIEQHANNPGLYHGDLASFLARPVTAFYREGCREAVAYTGAHELMDEGADWATEAAIAALRGES